MTSIANTATAAATVDPVQALWDEYQRKVASWEAEGSGGRASEESTRAMDEAEERFVEHETTSPIGMLLKLEHAVDCGTSDR